MTLLLLTAEKETLQLQLKERDERYAAELKKEQEEIVRLKGQLETMKVDHQSKVERIRAGEKDRQDAELRDCKGELGRTKKSLTTTSQMLKDLQAKAECWKTVLTKINAELASKYLHRFCLGLLSFGP